eukprot:11465626-Alexandrium_andersonii.AAC.1
MAPKMGKRAAAGTPEVVRALRRKGAMSITSSPTPTVREDDSMPDGLDSAGCGNSGFEIPQAALDTQ